jgi:hypothetical protein
MRASSHPDVYYGPRESGLTLYSDESINFVFNMLQLG